MQGKDLSKKRKSRPVEETEKRVAYLDDLDTSDEEVSLVNPIIFFVRINLLCF